MSHAEAMRLARERAGLTVKELTEKAQLGNHTLGNWEKGHCLPRIDSAVMVADVLGISVAEYIGHKPKNLENKPSPCEACSVRKYYAEAFDAQIWGDDCPHVCLQYKAWKGGESRSKR